LANDSGNIDQTGRRYLSSIDKYKVLWEREKAIRAEEEKADDLPKVKFTTSKGDIVILVLENEAPNTTANFINLVEKKFYDGLKFHRVIAGFMAQGGDPKGDGSGGPGYTIPDECRQNNHRIHFRGSLSMAKTAAPDTGGSQFFLTFVPTGHLDGQHTVFGRVIEGFDVLAKLQRIEPGGPGTPDKIVKAEVLRKRKHKYDPLKRVDK
jgi:cyclophilin family peptidyl-prolyl cis-trans isomerase